jgi:hypothetical protein
MVPSLDALPEMRGWSAEDAKLSWRYKDAADKEKAGFVVHGFGGKLDCGGWADDLDEIDDDDGPPPSLDLT